MKPIIDSIWNAVKEKIEYLQDDDKNIIFDDSKYDAFKNEFENLYESIKEKYMNKHVTALDRHKVAAVMIVSLLKTNVIAYKKISDKFVFIGSEMIATEIALSWMCQNLNERLNELKIEVEITEYIMPRAFACDTPYFEIFSRNLFFAQENYKLNPLDIAEKLFLLEYITIIKNNIDPILLHE